jgi:hypothetical protein
LQYFLFRRCAMGGAAHSASVLTFTTPPAIKPMKIRCFPQPYVDQYHCPPWLT